MRQLTLWSVTLASCGVFLGQQALAGDRVLKRDAVAEKLVRQKAHQVKKAVQQEHPECTAKTLKGFGLPSYACKIRILTAAAQAIEIPTDREPKKNKGLKQRAALVAAASRLGLAAANYTPINKVEDLEKNRFKAQALSCSSVESLYDVLLAMPDDSLAKVALKDIEALPDPLKGKPLKDNVCACLTSAQKLGDSAFLSPSDTLLAGVKRTLYSRGCFLDVEAGSSTLVDLKRGNPGVSPDSRAGTTAVGRVEQARTFATSRAFQLKHCVEKYGGRRGRGADQDKLQRCTCGITAKWRFPKSEKDDTEIEFPLIKDMASYSLSIEASGAVKECRVDVTANGKKQ